MIDRVERSDILNAAALAAVLLVLGYGMLVAFGQLSNTVDDGLFVAESIDSGEPVEVLGNALLRPANEVSVRVGNGSDGRQGLAGRATDRLGSAGYGTLTPENKEGDPMDESFVYYIDGFKVDAIQIATVLKIAEGQVRPLLDNPGVSTEGADVVVVLGQSADF